MEILKGGFNNPSRLSFCKHRGHRGFRLRSSTFPIIIRIEQKHQSIDLFFFLGDLRSPQQELLLFFFFGKGVQGIYLRKKINHSYYDDLILGVKRVFEISCLLNPPESRRPLFQPPQGCFDVIYATFLCLLLRDSVPMTRELNLFPLFFLTLWIDSYKQRQHAEEVSLISDRSRIGETDRVLIENTRLQAVSFFIPQPESLQGVSLSKDHVRLVCALFQIGFGLLHG